MNKINPKISIITITFNSENTLEETIQSITSQDYDNLEYLIIDGGSKDGTLDIVEKYRNKISFVISEPDKGISDAFNKGIAHATGDIIGIINSDDILLPNALKTVSKYYDPQIDVYSGNVMIWDDQTGNFYIKKPTITFDSFSIKLKACHPARFIARQAYERFGRYSLDLRYRMDLDLLYRFYRMGAKFIHIDNTLAKFRIGGTTSDNLWKKRKDFLLFVTNNGGTKYDFYKLWTIANIRNFAKKTVFAIFGEKWRFSNH